MADKELTELQKRFLDALFDEAKGNHKKAMKIAGYSDNSRVADVVYPLKDEIIKRGKEYVAVNAPTAMIGLVDVISDPSKEGAKNIISAAKEILDRGGITKPEQVEIKGSGGGIFILPPKRTTLEIEDLSE